MTEFERFAWSRRRRRRRPRPGLALLLALVAVPGSTVAWDLLAGGLYVGLPLAIAAIRGHRISLKSDEFWEAGES